MAHRRHRQIKKAEMMSNPLVLFGVSFMTPDGKEVFVDSKVMEERKNIGMDRWRFAQAGTRRILHYDRSRFA